jgi:hypothetical protein
MSRPRFDGAKGLSSNKENQLDASVSRYLLFTPEEEA